MRVTYQWQWIVWSPSQAATGLVVNIMCIAVLTASVNTIAVPVFYLNTFPEWAVPINGTNTSVMCWMVLKYIEFHTMYILTVTIACYFACTYICTRGHAADLWPYNDHHQSMHAAKKLAADCYLGPAMVKAFTLCTSSLRQVTRAALTLVSSVNTACCLQTVCNMGNHTAKCFPFQLS